MVQERMSCDVQTQEPGLATLYTVASLVVRGTWGAQSSEGLNSLVSSRFRQRLLWRTVHSEGWTPAGPVWQWIDFNAELYRLHLTVNIQVIFHGGF